MSGNDHVAILQDLTEKAHTTFWLNSIEMISIRVISHTTGQKVILYPGVSNKTPWGSSRGNTYLRLGRVVASSVRPTPAQNCTPLFSKGHFPTPWVEFMIAKNSAVLAEISRHVNPVLYLWKKKSADVQDTAQTPTAGAIKCQRVIYQECLVWNPHQASLICYILTTGALWEEL